MAINCRELVKFAEVYRPEKPFYQHRSCSEPRCVLLASVHSRAAGGGWEPLLTTATGAHRLAGTLSPSMPGVGVIIVTHGHCSRSRVEATACRFAGGG
jgi:hypothetical protein